MSQSRKIVLLLVSLLGAVVLWLYVVTNIATETTKWIRNIPIIINGASIREDRVEIYSQGKYYVITDQDIDSVSLEISTSRANMNKLNASTIGVTASIGRIPISRPGEYDFDLSISDLPNTVRSSDVEIIAQSKAKVRVTVDELIMDHQMDIELVTVGSRDPEYVIETESVELSPGSVFITGPKSEVDQIARVVVSYDTTDLREDAEAVLPVQFLNAEGEELTLSELTNVTVEETRMLLPVNRLREIRMSLGYIESPGVSRNDVQATLSPETITVKGPDDVLDRLGGLWVLDDSIDLGEIDLHWSKDYELSLPAGVTNVSGQTEIHAEIQLNGIVDRHVTVKEDDILISEAPPAGLYPEIVTKEAQVPVRGHNADVQKLLTGGQNGLVIQVDLSDFTEPGTYTVQGVVVSPEGSNVSVQNVEIAVVISDTPPVTEPPENS